MKINLGSGAYPLSGWKNVDRIASLSPDECYDISEGIREEENSVDEILISHVLMYSTLPQVVSILKDCYRVLKSGGLIRITEDNSLFKFRSVEQLKQYGEGVLMDRLTIVEFLRRVGFIDIQKAEPFPEVQHHIELPDTYPLAKGRATVYFVTAEKPVVVDTPDTVVYLGLDDFGETNSNMDLLWRLREHFQNFKINLFAIPDDCLRDSWVSYINSLGWIKLFIHGYYHLHSEDLDEKTLSALEGMFAKGYKAPYWELTDSMYEKLKSLGYKIFLQPSDKREGIKYNWDIKDPPPFSEISPRPSMELHGYGHCYPHDYISKNGNKGNSLYLYWENIMKLPKATKFKLY